MLLVIIGGFGVYRATQKPEGPPREFLDLEFAGADAERTGSCYSLSTVLIANSAFSNATREWTLVGDGEEEEEEKSWRLAIEDLVEETGSPVHVFQRYTFERKDARVELVSVEVSEGQSISIKDHVDALLEAPNDIHSTPVERCRDPAAQGYEFKRKKS
jgi:hypothetical protein